MTSSDQVVHNLVVDREIHLVVREASVDFHGKISCDRHSREVGAQFDMGDIDLGDLFGAFGFWRDASARGTKYRGSNKNDVQRIRTWIYKDIDVPDYRDGKQQGTKKVRIDHSCRRGTWTTITDGWSRGNGD
jgi:hypothetical protein